MEDFINAHIPNNSFFAPDDPVLVRKKSIFSTLSLEFTSKYQKVKKLKLPQTGKMTATYFYDPLTEDFGRIKALLRDASSETDTLPSTKTITFTLKHPVPVGDIQVTKVILSPKTSQNQQGWNEFHIYSTYSFIARKKTVRKEGFTFKVFPLR